MKPAAARLSVGQVAEFLRFEEPTAARTVRVLRRTVLKAAPMASEAIRFHSLCYFHGGAFFGSIGGNICMIEVKAGKVALSFIRGAEVDDPTRLLRGRGKLKRFVPIADAAAARSPAVSRLIRAAARLEPSV